MLLTLCFVLAAGTVHVGGVDRSYELFVPSDLGPSPALVLVLHGRGGSGAQVREHTGFDAQAALHGFVVAYPDGVDQKWRDLRQLTLGLPYDASDATFVLALIDTLVVEQHIDRARVFIAGHSNGAMMALALACTHADKFAGIASVAGSLAKAPCVLSRALPALFFHGTDDPMVKYAGGGVGPRGARGFVLSSDDTVARFAARAHCTSMVAAAPRVDSIAGMSATFEHHLGCTVPVVRVRIDHGGHGWPGHPSAFITQASRADTTAAVDASVEIGSFFDAIARANISPAAPPLQSPAP